jgi:hypothetical protein
LIKGDHIITHAQKIMSNDVLLVPPHEFEHPLRCFRQLYEIKINW